MWWICVVPVGATRTSTAPWLMSTAVRPTPPPSLPTSFPSALVTSLPALRPLSAMSCELHAKREASRGISCLSCSTCMGQATEADQLRGVAAPSWGLVYLALGLTRCARRPADFARAVTPGRPRAEHQLSPAYLLHVLPRHAHHSQPPAGSRPTALGRVRLGRPRPPAKASAIHGNWLHRTRRDQG